MKSLTIGYITTMLYCLTTALSFLVVHHFNVHLSPELGIFGAFTITVILAHACCFKSLGKVYQIVFNHPRTIFFMNITTAMTWFFGFFALAYIPAWLCKP